MYCLYLLKDFGQSRFYTKRQKRNTNNLKYLEIKFLRNANLCKSSVTVFLGCKVPSVEKQKKHVFFPSTNKHNSFLNTQNKFHISTHARMYYYVHSNIVSHKFTHCQSVLGINKTASFFHL